MNLSVFEEEIVAEVKFFNVLSTQDVYKQMTKHVFKVQEVAQLPANLIRRLLHKFTWDSDKLLEAIFEDEKLTALNYELAPVTEQMDCEICFDTFKDPAKIEVFECNHRCCVDCLNGYLVSQISDGGLLNCICCPGFNCKYELDDEFVLQHLSEQIKIKYKQIITNSFVSSNKMLKWCPTANCTKAIEIKTGFLLGLNESVRCACANYFCFKCDASVPHDPLTCELFERWQEDAKDKLNDMKSEEWMKKFTKQCPKCRVKIEKNGGCYHMSCRNCKHEFCWKCMKSFIGHSTCQKDAAQSRANLSSSNRYAFYREKYDEMNEALNLDIGRYRNFINYRQEVELLNQWVKVDFIAVAIEILLLSRRTIMNSYVFIYYMTTVGNQIFLLENLIEELYKFTEELAFLLENGVSANNVYDIKPEALNKTQICKSRRKTLMEYIKEGDDQKWWRMFPIPPEELLGEGTADDVAVVDLI